MVHDVAIVTPAIVTNRYQDEVPDWDNVTRQHLKGWVAQQSRGEVHQANRDALVSQWVARLPLDADLDGRKRLEAHGLTFEVVGRPNVAKTGRGPHHVHAQLELVEG